MRFANEVASVLSQAGWAEGRQVDDFDAPFDTATAALREFGGLYVLQDGPGTDLRRRPFALDPTQVAATTETLSDLSAILGTRLFPIGMEGDHDAILAIDESGRVFAFDHAGTWHLGDTLDAALTTVVTGTQPARIDIDGHW